MSIPRPASSSDERRRCATSLCPQIPYVDVGAIADGAARVAPRKDRTTWRAARQKVEAPVLSSNTQPQRKTRRFAVRDLYRRDSDPARARSRRGPARPVDCPSAAVSRLQHRAPSSGRSRASRGSTGSRRRQRRRHQALPREPVLKIRRFKRYEGQRCDFRSVRAEHVEGIWRGAGHGHLRIGQGFRLGLWPLQPPFHAGPTHRLQKIPLP